MVPFKTATSLFFAAALGGGAEAEAMLKLSPDAIQRHLTNRFGGVNGVLPNLAVSHNRKILEEECPETPLLWKIVDKESGNHVGFGLGTMHLPEEILLSDSAKDSIMNAIQDSCNIYGELNLLDPAVQLELQACMAPLAGPAATVADIPDQDVKAAYEAKLLEIATAVASEESFIDTIHQSLLSLPLFLAQQFITYFNTPEYEPYLLQTLTGQSITFLDETVLGQGRVADGVEEVSTQCSVLEGLYLPPEKLDTQSLLVGLNASLSESINAYRCGNDVELDSALTAGGELSSNSEFEEQILYSRNEQMASAIVEALQASDEKALFAIGFLHWLHGERSLKNLLNEYGYSLEILQTYGPDDAEDLSNEQCSVKLNPDTGLYEHFETSDSGGASTVTTASDNSGTMTDEADQDSSSNTLSISIAAVFCIMSNVYLYFMET